eukprot:CAMPEP_0194047634 /NCGR_PEP_ID=MMETSP0009_2-20130614/25083_1 /TAXON_ID=210454 /ORGANISM="Grammatophora oceanica, Strain CCMP 410" /LENGTH=777 /DNA_ID=CAMNT_0038693303 /DNA_START=67 /DNA_END=2400 /DNA_ORIENTATION=-
MTTIHSTQRHLRVLSASTGVCYNISLHPQEFTISNIRRHLAAAVPVSDQILLLGPPYKVPKDSTLRSEEVLESLRLGDEEDAQNKWREKQSSGARRLFLFSKQSLSDQAPDPPACVLEPSGPPTLPTQPGPSPLHINPASSPLHQALEVYERRFMLHLDQGRVLADAADLRFSACRSCVAEQTVMARALRAAVSNLGVHLNGTLRVRSELSTDFTQKTQAHSAILTKFETLLVNLGQIPLHPSLVSLARASGHVMESLVDTVPVDRERAWAGQCQTSHQRLMTMFHDLEVRFTQLGTTQSREQEARQDLLSEEQIQKLWEEVEHYGREIRDRQSKRLDSLTRDHGEVVKVVMNAIAGDGAQAAFATLEELSKSSADIVPSMQTDDESLRALMNKVAESKTAAMKRMKIRLREVSVAQSAIQGVNADVTVLRNALQQQSDNMVHLEHVAELPESYRDFLSELRRRRAYGGAVTASSTAMMERLASMRVDEVKAREKFLRGAGRHLMPPFFEVFAPTLATPPPLFTPQLPAMLELDTLPDLGPAEIVGGHSDAVMEGGVSSASSLTAASPPPAPSVQETETQDQLIVSADEGDGLIVEPSAAASRTDAENKTLAYENAVLRQALERLGGKSPRSYVDDARDASVMQKQADDEISKLRKELEEAKLNAKTAKEEAQKVVTTKKQDDRISHSSFGVGDVGLFMPTGRGSPGGKRTYLAFHTNCPHRYLSTDNIQGTPDFVLGRIVYQEDLVAGEVGTDANPYGLHVGTRFWVLTVEVLNQP